MPVHMTSTWKRLIIKRGEGRNDPFEKHLRDVARPGQIRFTLAMRACKGSPAGFEFKKHDRDAWAVVLPEPAPEGAPPLWRVLTFDERGFSGHSAHPTDSMALQELLLMGFESPDAGALDRCQQKPLWGIAEEQHATMMQFMEGVIDISTYRETMDKIAEQHGLPMPFCKHEQAHA